MFDNAFKKTSSRYRAAGEQVLDVYRSMTKGKSNAQILAERATIIAAMVNKINSFPSPTMVSYHCADPAILRAIDLAPSEFGTSSGQRFAQRAALRATESKPVISRFLGPDTPEGDAAFHLEIPQPGAGSLLATAPTGQASDATHPSKAKGLAKQGAMGALGSSVVFVNGAASVSGTVSIGQREFTFQAKQGDAVWIGLTAIQHRPGTLWDDGDTVIYLLNSENHVLAFNDDDIEGGFQSSIGGYVIPATGTYKLVVVTFGNEPVLDAGGHVTGWQGSGGSNVDFAISISLFSSPEILVEQPTGTRLVDGVANIQFGSVNTGSYVDLTFTIRNTGAPDLSGLGIIIDGTDASSFSVIASPTGPVSSPNGSTTFTVLFAPTTPGVKIAALHIASNDVDENPFDVTLTGTGVVPTPSVPSVTALSSGNNLTLLWPDSATGYRVESTLSLSPPLTWSNVTGSFQTNGGSISIVLPITDGQKYYRLAKP